MDKSFYFCFIVLIDLFWEEKMSTKMSVHIYTYLCNNNIFVEKLYLKKLLIVKLEIIS